VYVDHVRDDVPGRPALARGGGGPLVVVDGGDRCGEVAGQAVVALGDVGHGHIVRPRPPKGLNKPDVASPLVVRSVDDDARGILAPDAGLARFSLERFAPGERAARFVDRYWTVTWDLRGEPSHTQHVLAHPVVNVTFQDGGDGMVNGVTTRLTARTLSGAGRVLGVMFRPAGFRPLLWGPAAAITDRTVPLAEILGAAAATIAEAVAAATGPADMAAAADAALAPLLPVEIQPSEETTRLVERVATDPSLVRVAELAVVGHCTSRQLQRRFADHVGVPPKAVIRRYRLYDAAERARSGHTVDWAGVAADLGYSDQAHLTRDFTAAFGVSPGRYLRANRGEVGADPPIRS
jgi:AraC-like DNA-binding protein